MNRNNNINIISANQNNNSNSNLVRSASNINTGPKKIPIKSLSKNGGAMPTLSENFHIETWLKLQSAVSALFRNSAVSYSLEELFQFVNNLCLHQKTKWLFETLQEECKRHISNSIRVLRDFPVTDNIVFLNRVNDAWKDHCERMILIQTIFTWLDRTYIKQSGEGLSIWDMGIVLLREQLMESGDGGGGAIHHRVVSATLELIEKEMQGNTVDRSLIKSLVHMLCAIQTYISHFEKPLLDAASRIFKEEALVKVNECEVSEYLKHVEAKLADEIDRVNSYLDPSTLQVFF
jgi:cullin-4